MEPKKLKKLVLKKETIANLSDFEQNRLKGGDFWDKLHEYLTGTMSHFEIANCIGGNVGSVCSYCACVNSGLEPPAPDPNPGSDCCGTGPCTTVPCGNSGNNPSVLPVCTISVNC